MTYYLKIIIKSARTGGLEDAELGEIRAQVTVLSHIVCIFIHPFVRLPNKHLFSTCCVPHPVLSARDSERTTAEVLFPFCSQVGDTEIHRVSSQCVLITLVRIMGEGPETEQRKDLL